MKKFKLLAIISIVLVVVLSFGLLTACEKPDDDNDGQDRTPTQGLELVLSVDGDSYVVTGIGKATDTDIVIPSEYNGKPITKVTELAFYENTDITSVVIPDSVTEIGDGAFAYCPNLEEIEIGDGVTTIGYGAFMWCNSLKSVEIPDSVTTLGDHAFAICESLTGITVSDSNTAYKSINGSLYTKDGKTLIQYAAASTATSYTTPSEVTTIKDYAFTYSNSLQEVVIGDSVTTVGQAMFCYSNKLQRVTIGKGVASIGNTAFLGCSSLTEINYNAKECADLTSSHEMFFKAGKDGIGITVNVGANVKKIPNFFFRNANISKVVINGSSLKTIGNSAFSGCSFLTSITIPDSVTSIGDNAFEGCYRLVEVCNKSSLSIAAGQSSYGNMGFYAMNVYTPTSGASKLSVDNDGYIIYSDNSDKVLVSYVGTQSALVLPSNITKINKYAFYKCDTITNIEIPDSVTSIGDNAFEGCYRLVEVCNKSSLSIAAGQSDYGKVGFYAMNVYTPTSGASKLSVDNDGYIIYADNNDIILVGYVGTQSALVLPSNLTKIHNYAFYYCDNLTSIIIPDSVTSIGDFAFYYCEGLTNVKIGDSVTAIGKNAFAWCNSITSITIPDSVISIASGAFALCDKLDSITFENTDDWYVFDSQTDMRIDDIPSTRLADSSTAAQLLTDSYYWYNWKRR